MTEAVANGDQKPPTWQRRLLEPHIAEFLSAAVRPLNDQSQPNLQALAFALQDLKNIKLNIKLNGYALARQLAAELPVRTDLAPRFVGLASKCSTQADMTSDWVAYWLGQLGSPVLFHRKLWEYAYVLQHMWDHGILGPGKRALGFGCGQEPVPSLLAAMGVSTTITDLMPDAREAQNWSGSQQHTASRDSCFYPHIVDREAFDAHVALRYVDMRAIPADLTDFDCCWSICALEHLGSIQAGLDFIRNALSTLKPGGVAIHTTELNYLSEDQTVDNWPTVLFLRKHFEDLTARLTAEGHEVVPLDFNVGSDPLDLFVDLPPYPDAWSAYEASIFPPSMHLKLSIAGFASTCFGITVRRRAG